VSSTRLAALDVDERRRKQIVLSAAVFAVVLLLDQLTKHWAVNALDDRNIDMFWTLRFNLVFNEGVAFSLGDGGGYGPILAVAAVGVLGTVAYMGSRLDDTVAAVSVGLVLGGAVGNLTDRLFRADDGILSGKVVDFVDVQWWPVFNVADAAVIFGGIGLVWASWKADQ
jgi:signal peptidase II